MPERKRMAIGPNARRGGNIEDRRGWRYAIPRARVMNTIRAEESAIAANTRLREQADYWNQTDPSVRGMRGDRVFNHVPQVGDTVGAPVATHRRTISPITRNELRMVMPNFGEPRI